MVGVKKVHIVIIDWDLKVQFIIWEVPRYPLGLITLKRDIPQGHKRVLAPNCNLFSLEWILRKTLDFRPGNEVQLPLMDGLILGLSRYLLGELINKYLA